MMYFAPYRHGSGRRNLARGCEGRHGFLSLKAAVELAGVLGALASAVIVLPYLMEALIGVSEGDLERGKLPDPVYDVTGLISDGQVYYFGINGKLYWIDLAARLRDRVTMPPGMHVTALSRSSDGRALAVGLLDGRVLLQQPNGSQIVQITREDTITALEFSPDDDLLAVGTSEGVICVWDMVRTSHRFQLPNAKQHVFCLRWLPDGRLISGGVGNCRLWDLETKHAVREFVGHLQPVHSADVSLHGELLVTASPDSTVRGWEIESGRPLWCTAFDAPDVPMAGGIGSVVLHPAGPVACGKNLGEGTIWLLDRHTGQILCELPGHSRGTSTMRLNRDGSRLITAGYDGRIQVWEAGPSPEDWRGTERYDCHQP